jgi:hypothetical protein
MGTREGSEEDRLEKFLSRIQTLRILVVGDLTLERFLSGNLNARGTLPTSRDCQQVVLKRQNN